ncbi:HD-GYP domain-containing protein [Ammoniphilus sp. YIM 78166]|uniref:HD-GYP domain-containing protein n=1 Tax=Ammoniphilus sp. YIM 78166 TaxID=1644106 RepID=UPI00106FDC2A|nr:HD-GYP domain-containing protein [Ammoniphilus sp. YIM 78166]
MNTLTCNYRFDTLHPYINPINELYFYDPLTYQHSYNVMMYSSLAANELGLSEPIRRSIELGALLHDIGKLMVPRDILLKPIRLTTEEFEIMKKHPQLGYHLIKDKFHCTDPIILDIIRFHHERYDGATSGYPLQLKGSEIPLAARIVSVADAYDAMTSARSYKTAREKSCAQQELRKHSGTQFDPMIVEVLLDVLHDHTPVPSNMYFAS